MFWHKFIILKLLIACLFLQGCMTTSIVMDKAKGVIDFPVDVDSAQFDSNHNEYVICISEIFNKHPELFTIIVSNKIIANDGDDRGSITKKNIKDETKSHWWGYEDRKDLLVYMLKTRVDDGCKPASKSSVNIPIIKANESVDSSDDTGSLIQFKGNLIHNMLEKNTPFTIFIPSRYVSFGSYNFFNPFNKFSPCDIEGEVHSCVLLFIQPLSNKNYQEIEYSELLSIEELTYSKIANPLWYLALPFSVAIDASIDMIAIFILMSMVGIAGA